MSVSYPQASVSPAVVTQGGGPGHHALIPYHHMQQQAMHQQVGISDKFQIFIPFFYFLDMFFVISGLVSTIKSLKKKLRLNYLEILI